MQRKKRIVISSLIALASLALTYAPIPGIKQKIIVVSGTELAEPLTELAAQFEETYPNLDIELKFQGSQDLVNKYLDAENDFTPTVLIPASGEILTELSDRWQVQNQSEPFYSQPQPLVKTFLVGIAWPERGKVLFPQGRFDWDRLETAMTQGSWGNIGGDQNWGSFDFVITDPTRSNSGQMGMALWTKAKTGGNMDFNAPEISYLFGLVRRSVYLPPRSTDILLQEFIAKGPNDADVAIVYESIALHRWSQATKTQNKPYQIYYLDPTFETVATGAIARRDINARTAQAAQKWLDFLVEPEQQQVFVTYGFRPVDTSIDLESAPNSPWQQNIPGVEANPNLNTLNAPNPQARAEIQRLWQRAQP